MVGVIDRLAVLVFVARHTTLVDRVTLHSCSSSHAAASVA